MNDLNKRTMEALSRFSNMKGKKCYNCGFFCLVKKGICSYHEEVTYEHKSCDYWTPKTKSKLFIFIGKLVGFFTIDK